MERGITQQHPEHLVKPLPIADGGTGAKIVSEARQNLNAVPLTQIGVALGITPLNANSKIPSQYLPAGDVNSVSVTGPLTLFTNDIGHYTITDYDLDTTYIVTAEHGVINLTHDTFTYTPNATPTQQTIIVNGVNYVINVYTASLLKPTILNPVNNTSGLDSPLTINVSDFSYLGPPPSEHTLVCQISTSSDFNTLVRDISTLTVTSLNTTLPNAPYYYIRVKYQAPGYVDSEWSDTVTLSAFLTLPIHEYQVLSPSDFSTSGRFGETVAIADDNSRIFISCQDAQNSGVYASGAVYVFKNNNGVYEQEIKISPPTPVNSSRFGNCFAINAVGDTLVVGDDYAPNTTVQRVYVFKLVNNVWTFITSLPTPVTYTVTSALAFSSDGNKLALQNQSNDRHIDIYSFDGTTLSLEATVTLDIQVLSGSGIYMWNNISLNHDGTVLAVGSGSDGLNQSGAVCIFNYANAAWSQVNVLYPDAQTYEYSGQKFGCTLKMNRAGTLLLVGDAGNVIGTGYKSSIYVFALENSTWVRKSRFTPTNRDGINGWSEYDPIDFSGDDQYVITGGQYVYSNYAGSADLLKLENGILTQVYEYNRSIAGEYFGSSAVLSKDLSLAVVGMGSYSFGNHVRVYN